MSRIASYFSKADRKKLFFDYLKLIGILEIIIFIVIALWSADDKYHRVYTPFPWKEYLFVAFAFPIMLTFLLGVIVTGFNYFLGQDVMAGQEEEETGGQELPLVNQLKRLPLLAILFLLLVTILALYNIHHIMTWLSSLTASTFAFLSYVLAGAGVVVTIYMLFFLFFKYRLNQRQMKYQYYSQISERHGLIILDDRTVLHKSGQLLVQGKRWGRPKQAKKTAVAPDERTVTVSPEEPELLSSNPRSQSQLPAPKP
jgi:magnesium-transporting ATPase (P-type)